jgi:ATPase family protein associated with various cellular activities (AAA)
MSWQDHNIWSRWLVLSACAPRPKNGRIALSEVGSDLDYIALSRAIVPDVVPDKADDDWIEAVWNDAPSDHSRDRVVSYLQWLVLSDAASARNFVGYTPSVLSFPEAWRATGTFAHEAGPDFRTEATRVAHECIISQTDYSKHVDRPALTSSQRLARISIHAMASAYFRGLKISCGITPRLAPLLIGPTGAGKSSLVRSVAEECGANYIRTSVGEWIPVGAREARTTIKVIAELLAKSPSGLIVMVDEMDKVATDQSSWGRSSMTEIFSVLDRSFLTSGALPKMAD